MTIIRSSPTSARSSCRRSFTSAARAGTFFSVALAPSLAGNIDRSTLLAHRRELPSSDLQVLAPALDPDFDMLLAPPPTPLPKLDRYRLKPPPSLAPASVRAHSHNEIGIEYSLNQAGRLYEAAGEIDRALRSYRAAMIENPTFLLAYYNLVRLYRALGMDDQVREVWRQLLKVNPDNRTANTELALYHLGRQQFDLARPHLESLVRLHPQDAFSMHNLGVTCAQAGDAETAVHWFRAASAISSSLDYPEVLQLPAFDRIRSTPAFQAFALEVGAEQALIAASPGTPVLLAADQRISNEFLLPIAKALMRLGLDQDQTRVYNVVIYNGLREVDTLLVEKPAVVEGLARVIQHSEAVMLVYSSSPDASRHINDTTTLSLRQQAQTAGMDAQWFDREGVNDLTMSPADAGEPVRLRIEGALILRMTVGSPPVAPASFP